MSMNKNLYSQLSEAKYANNFTLGKQVWRARSGAGEIV
jgi:hypothetical protein